MESEKLQLLKKLADNLSALVSTYQEAIEKDAVLSEKKDIRFRMKEILSKINSLKDEMSNESRNN
jgi:hypothetical protein